VFLLGLLHRWVDDIEDFWIDADTAHRWEELARYYFRLSNPDYLYYTNMGLLRLDLNFYCSLERGNSKNETVLMSAWQLIEAGCLSAPSFDSAQHFLENITVN